MKSYTRVRKNTFSWRLYNLNGYCFTIVFQAILISMCLQGMVDELMMKKQGGRMKRVRTSDIGATYTERKRKRMRCYCWKQVVISVVFPRRNIKNKVYRPRPPYLFPTDQSRLGLTRELVGGGALSEEGGSSFLTDPSCDPWDPHSLPMDREIYWKHYLPSYYVRGR